MPDAADYFTAVNPAFANQIAGTNVLALKPDEPFWLSGFFLFLVSFLEIEQCAASMIRELVFATMNEFPSRQTGQ